MIDYAEALTVIDINTGSFTGQGKGRLEDTITKVNVEAAEEVVRQLRMRDIGGIIVIDFIDMARARNRDQVLKTLRTALDEDRTKTYVVEVSPLGLVEMTRQNVTDGVREILTKRCPTCDGEGVVASEETVAISIVRKLQEVVEEDPKPEAYLIRVNPQVAAELLDAGLRAHRARGGDRQALPLRGRRRPAARHLPRGRDGHPRGDRAARAAVPGRRGGPGLDRGAAHVQRRRRGRARRLLHRQRRRGGSPRRRAAHGADRERRALRGDRGAARQRRQRGGGRRQWKRGREARIRRPPAGAGVAEAGAAGDAHAPAVAARTSRGD